MDLRTKAERTEKSVPRPDAGNPSADGGGTGDEEIDSPLGIRKERARRSDAKLHPVLLLRQ